MQDAWLVPLRDVDEQAASYCRQHDLSYRRTDVVWISPTLKQVAYDCVWAKRPVTRKLEVRRPPVRPGHSVAVGTASEDPKAAAWAKARAATDAWVLCLRFDAERKGKETTDTPQSVAQVVVEACSELEQAVHAPLEAIDEDSSQFRADLHAQAIQNAADIVTNIRTKTGMPVSEPLAPQNDHQVAR